MKKKLRLRSWVKKTLIITTLVATVVFQNVSYENAVRTCIQNGNNISYCENGLR